MDPRQLVPTRSGSRPLSLASPSRPFPLLFRAQATSKVCESRPLSEGICSSPLPSPSFAHFASRIVLRDRTEPARPRPAPSSRLHMPQFSPKRSRPEPHDHLAVALGDRHCQQSCHVFPTALDYNPDNSNGRGQSRTASSHRLFNLLSTLPTSAALGPPIARCPNMPG